jgi:Zn-dependent peptidase ImmA (M78 family)
MVRVAVKPAVLQWAIERAGQRSEYLHRKFPHLAEWALGQAQPTLMQLESFAKAAYVPLGYLFGPEPPEEKLPIPDFRTRPPGRQRRPSPDLIETIYIMQRRQDWLREERTECGADPLDFVRSAKLSDDPVVIGQKMRQTVGLADGWAERITTWESALGELRRLIEELGVIAVINGIVGNNTHRPLRVEEFRGFVLCDDYAPVIFVNGADNKSAQMFTLAYELAHLWLGESALTDAGIQTNPIVDIEKWCDQAALEFLVPEKGLRTFWQEIGPCRDRLGTVAQRLGVSPVLVGRRAKDLGLIAEAEFFAFYRSYVRRQRRKKGAVFGGDFYQGLDFRVGDLFARQVFFAALEGRLSFKEAYSLIGLNGGTFQEYAAQLGVKLPCN